MRAHVDAATANDLFWLMGSEVGLQVCLRAGLTLFDNREPDPARMFREEGPFV